MSADEFAEMRDGGFISASSISIREAMYRPRLVLLVARSAVEQILIGRCFLATNCFDHPLERVVALDLAGLRVDERHPCRDEADVEPVRLRIWQRPVKAGSPDHRTARALQNLNVSVIAARRNAPASSDGSEANAEMRLISASSRSRPWSRALLAIAT